MECCFGVNKIPKFFKKHRRHASFNKNHFRNEDPILSDTYFEQKVDFIVAFGLRGCLYGIFFYCVLRCVDHGPWDGTRCLPDFALKLTKIDEVEDGGR